MKKETLEKTVEKIANSMSKLNEVVKELVTREEFNKKLDGLYQGQDKTLAILTHPERERIFAFDRIEKL